MTRYIMLAMVFVVACSVTQAQNSDQESLYYANAYADHYGVSRALVHAIVEQESGWNPLAVSNKGARGLSQLMPGTSQTYGVRNPFSKSENLSGCVRYLRNLLWKFHGDMRLAVAAYYTGEHPIERRGLSFSNPDVVAYVEQVRRRYQRNLMRLVPSPQESQP